jgi:hypothetical protein
MAWYEATAKEYPIISEVYPNLQDCYIPNAFLIEGTVVSTLHMAVGFNCHYIALFILHALMRRLFPPTQSKV